MEKKETRNITEPKDNDKKEYEKPEYEEHEPLEIMRAWEDRSSELPGI